jgi:hypothetical protein
MREGRHSASAMMNKQEIYMQPEYRMQRNLGKSRKTETILYVATDHSQAASRNSAISPGRNWISDRSFSSINLKAAVVLYHWLQISR